MDGPQIRHAWLMGATLGMLAMAAAPHAARGGNWLPTPSGCNQTPNPGTGTFTMIGDAIGTAGCCAVVLAPNQTLKMNNHTITCTGAGTTGVCLTGSNEMLKGPGVIQGCTTGASIGVNTTGGLVKDVQLMGNGTGVTDAASPFASKIVGNFVIANSNAGIESSAALAVVAANHVTMNPVGVSVTAGTALVENNFVLSNTGPGISVSSSTPGTVVQTNYVLANSGDGIDVTATGVGALITANQVNWNTGNGIDLASGATACRVIKNIAHLNTGGDDLFDGNAGCTGNTWTADLFGSSNQVCVQ